MELHIYVEEGAKSKSANEMAETKNIKPTQKDKKTAQKKAEDNATQVKMLANYAQSIAKSAIMQSANYFISDIGRRNGDSNYQQLINRKLEVAKDALGFGVGVVSGAKLGAAAGPIGAAAGAALGIAISGISLGFKYAERDRAYQFELFQENNSQAYNLARANYSALTGRVR